MALETLKGVKEIGGYKVLSERPMVIVDGTTNAVVDWDSFDEMRKAHPIHIDHDVNMISFRIQDGPIGENGVNGCQVDTLIEVTLHIINELNKKFPCQDNEDAVNSLDEALWYLKQRTKDREARGVEGTSNA